MVSRSTRAVRAWIAAGFATAIAVASHTLGGGSFPQPLVLAFSLAISGLLCMTLAGKILSLPRLCWGVLLSQAIFHALFSIAPTNSITGADSELAGVMHHAGTHSMPMLLAAPGMPEMGHNSWPMLGAHLVAALLTIALLRRGEVAAIALWLAIITELRGFASIRLTRTPDAPKTISTVATSHFRVLTDLGAPRLTMRHRGPPVFLALS